jgi:hypothetical protein
VVSFDVLSAGATIVFPWYVQGYSVQTQLSVGNGTAPLYIAYPQIDDTAIQLLNGAPMTCASATGAGFFTNGAGNTNPTICRIVVIKPQVTPTQTEVATFTILGNKVVQ